jgi:predicted MPP superfamily phosphohydrolase
VRYLFFIQGEGRGHFTQAVTMADLLRKNGHEIVIAGIENWGAKGNFSKYGDIHKTLKNVQPDEFVILMSHDPSHWRAQVLEHPSNVNLTLAGHTHGMQFGADTRWLKWSPVQFMYKEWMDLYKVDDKHLYVNRGLGFIGYPGRVGIDPEITHFTLRKG